MDSDVEGLLILDEEGEPEEEEEEWHPWYSRPFYSILGYVRRVNGILGWRFVLYLLFSQLICKGALRQIVNSLMLPLFRDSVDAAQLQLYTMIVMLPWAVKPLLGLCSDLVLVAGYKKRSWILIGIGIAFGCCVGLFFSIHIPLVVVFLFMGIQFMIALIDLLTEAKYAEVRNENPKLGSDASNLAQGMQSVGVLLVMSFIGFIGDAKLFTVAFVIMLTLAVSPTLPTLFGWLPEIRKIGGCFIQLINREKLYEERGVIIVVGICGLSSIVSGVVATFASPIIGLSVAFALLVVCLAGCWIVFPSGVTEVALYQVISIISQPSMGSALDYFYTATPDCLPDGPHFSYAYFITFAGLVGNIIGLLGVVFYQRFLSQLRFRPILLLTTIFGSIAGISDLIIVMRWNVALGISDKWAYLLGEAILEPFIGMLNWVPMSALISISVEKDMEASTFAFLAGISNFARGFSELSGVVIFTAAGVNTTAGSCNFEPMPILVIICHIVLPLMIAVPAVFLIANIYQTEQLNQE